MPLSQQPTSSINGNHNNNETTNTTTSSTSTGPPEKTGGGISFQLKQQTTNRKRKRINTAANTDAFGSSVDDNDDVPPKQPQQQQQQQVQITKPSSTSTNSPTNSNNLNNNNTNKRGSPTTTAATSTASTTSSAATSPASNTTTTSASPKQRDNNSNNKVQQPDGWRVKLYRLNADGSWDDCGTGRVLCLYRPAMAKANTSLPPITAAANNTDGPPYNAALDAWICQELGEPTLCMHAELVSEQSQPRILLRTRILLRDAYQRQGDNIITWCEPYYDNNNNNEDGKNNNKINNTTATVTNNTNNNNNLDNNNNGDNDSTGGGVDLALSFQDNAGCLDIWRQITHVQRRANELYRTHQSQQQQQPQQTGGDDSDDSGEGTDALPQQQRQQQAMEDHGMTSHNDQHHHSENIEHHNHAQHTNANINDNKEQPHLEMWVSMAGALEHSNHSPFDDDPDSGGANSNKQQQQQGDQHQHQHQQQHHLGGDDNNNNGDNGGYGHGTQQQQESGNNAMSNNNNNNNNALSPQLPNPPTLANLEEIADTIARVQHIQQRESLAIFISQHECSYLKSLLALFPSAEESCDYGSLATLAACVKTILLLNDPCILELIVTEEIIFEKVCATLEYDPDLRDKANHRWFLRERARFRTVVLMEDEELVGAIHRAFRVNYLRDTLLRPTMDESSLSTLSSLQTFTHADVVKGVTISPPPPQLHAATGAHGHGVGRHEHEDSQDSYLVRVIRVLGVELHALCQMEWAELESGSTKFPDIDALPTDPSIVVSSGKYMSDSRKLSSTWQQHLAPQDGSLASRRIRRRGCLTFLRELFNMVRISLQQSDKDNFFSVIVSMEIEVMSGVDGEKGGKISDNESQTSKIVEVGSVAASEKSERFDEKGEGLHLGLDFMPLSTPVNLLSLLGTVLSDPNTDVTEKGLVLEIIAGVAMHDPGLIRRHCLEFHSSWKRNQNHTDQDRDVAGLGRPEANEKKQVIFLCPPNDLLAALLFLLDAETDAGILLQVSEIMRIILDTDMMGEHGPTGFADETEHGVFADEAEGIPPGNGSGVQAQAQSHEQHNQMSGGGSTATTTEQKQFLSMFYEHFIDWLVAPFQFKILHPVRRVPDTVLISPSESPLLMQMMKAFKEGVTNDDRLFRIIPKSAIRTSFAVELLSFCVRAHLYRMKIFLLKSRVLSNVLKLLKPQIGIESTSGDRCLKLAALRFLRSILSVNDEFYNRHIIHHDLFSLVFDAFRANPVGDNLVSSAIVEMCDFINNENIMPLMEHIVCKHLSATQRESTGPSLEDVSSPYVSTLTTLRQSYEHNLEAAKQQQQQQGKSGSSPGSPIPHNQRPGDSRYFSGKPMGPAPRVLTGKALEDQRKFREEHDEESYFEGDDDDEDDGQQPHPPSNTVVPPAVDEVAAQEGDVELPRTSRVFSLSPTRLNHPTPTHRNDELEVKEAKVETQIAGRPSHGVANKSDEKV